ncbi:MAG TPA: hypothetical protein VF229_02600, partial [Burkholderiaceae bacterium]
AIAQIAQSISPAAMPARRALAAIKTDEDLGANMSLSSIQVAVMRADDGARIDVARNPGLHPAG